MTWHKKLAEKCTKCPLADLTLWQVLTIVAFVSVVCWRVIACEIGLSEIQKQQAVQSVTIGRLEYAISILEKLNDRLLK